MSKKIDITIEFDSKEIAQSSFLEIQIKKGYYEIVFEKVEFTKDITLEKEEYLDLSINSRGYYLYCFENTIIKKGYYEIFSLKIDRDTYLEPYQTSFYLSLIQSWINNEEKYAWRNLTNLRKKVWIEACLFWSGIQTVFIPEKEIFFESLEVNSERDLYCYLGELFFLDKGYLGQDLDGLEDCLRSFLRNESNNKVCINNFSHLEKILNTPKSFKKYKQKYTDILIEIFTATDFKIELS